MGLGHIYPIKVSEQVQNSIMNSFNKLRNLNLWIVLIFLCFLIQFFSLSAVFRFDRELIGQGEIWRLISGHLTHLNWTHLVLNMLGVAIVAIFFSNYQSTRYWLLAMLFIAISSSLGMLIDGQLERYVGFSSVLHGLFIIGGRLEMSRYKLSGIMLLAVLIAKLLWEQLFGAMPGSESMIEGHVALNSHLYGAIAGALYLLLTSHFVVSVFKKIRN